MERQDIFQQKMHKKGEYYKNETCKDCVNLIYPVNQ